MEPDLLLGISLGVLASIFMNVGKGVQKQKVEVLKKGWAMFGGPYRRDFMIWLVGILMTVCSAVLYSASLKFTDKSSIVACLSGTGLIGLLIYAWLVLKETVGIREALSSVLIIFGTGVISYFDQPLLQSQSYHLGNFFYYSLGLMIVFGILAFLGVRFVKWWGFNFGLIAGSLIGWAMILGDMALVKAGGSFLGQLGNIYVYLALFSATSALTLTQVAFFKGKAVLVVPTLNSFIILTPLGLEYVAFGTALGLIQYLGAGIIILGIIILTTSPKHAWAQNPT